MATKKRKKFPRQSASQRSSSSLQGARFLNSVVKKSRSGSKPELRLALPRNYEWLSQQGVIVPDELDSTSETLRVDFTRLNSRAIGAVHSRFCNRLAHALYVRAQVETEKLPLERKLHIEQARYRIRHESDFKTVKALEAAMSLDKRIKQMQNEILTLEVREVALDAVIKGYESIIRAASRDMSRRGIEAGNTSRD